MHNIFSGLLNFVIIKYLRPQSHERHIPEEIIVVILAKQSSNINDVKKKGYYVFCPLFAVVVERNHMSGLDLPNGRESSAELIDKSIPEETAVSISDTPYQPMQSPLREELPPIPGSGGDLDQEIEKLQTELERCKRENIGQGDAAPAYEEIQPVFAAGKLNAAPPGGGDQVDSRLATEPATTKSKDKKKHKKTPDKKERTCCGLIWRIFRFFLVTFIMLAVMLCILVVIAMETEAPIPLIQNIRTWPEVEHFKNEHYSPAKEITVDTIKSWFS